MPLIDPRTSKVLKLADETRFVPKGIVSRTLLQTPLIRMVLFGFAKGQELTEHTSTQRALIQVLSGECEFFLSGKPRRLKAGDMLHMPPGEPHAVRATSQFSMLLTLITTDAAMPAGSRRASGASSERGASTTSSGRHSA